MFNNFFLVFLSCFYMGHHTLVIAADNTIIYDSEIACPCIGCSQKWFSRKHPYTAAEKALALLIRPLINITSGRAKPIADLVFDYYGHEEWLAMPSINAHLIIINDANQLYEPVHLTAFMTRDPSDGQGDFYKKEMPLAGKKTKFNPHDIQYVRDLQDYWLTEPGPISQVNFKSLCGQYSIDTKRDQKESHLLTTFTMQRFCYLPTKQRVMKLIKKEQEKKCVIS